MNGHTASQLPMPSAEVLDAVVELLGTPDMAESEIEARGLILARGDELLARRLIDCLPEAFGAVLALRLCEQGQFEVPKTFSARDASGEWHEFPWDAEPLFPRAIRIAVHMFEQGPRYIVQNICGRSALVGALNNALNAHGIDALKCANLAGPSMLGLPAELYAVP